MATEALSFGAFIRRRRNERGLTLLDVAVALEISIPYLSRIERDREKDPRDELIRDLANILHVPEDDAFAAARRLPPDLQGRAAEVFALYRRLSR
ncbi:MAG: helix-turn-helix domain-containing protein [Bryobacteraceae bacterium]